MSYLWAQVRLGHLLLRSGDLAEAHQVLMENAQSFGKDGYTIGVIFALEGMAGLFAAVGKPEYTARLIGWADFMREKIHDTRPDIEQADIDKMIASCLTRMGEVAFSDAYEQGQQITLDQAIAFAAENPTLSAPSTTAQSRPSQAPVPPPKRPTRKSSKRTSTQAPE